MIIIIVQYIYNNYLNLVINNIYINKLKKFLIISIIFFIYIFFFSYILKTLNINNKKEKTHKFIISKCSNINIIIKYIINIYIKNNLIKKYAELIKLCKLIYLITKKNINFKILFYVINNYYIFNNNYKKNLFNAKWYNTKINFIINGNFILSARSVGLTLYDINSLINALNWQLDFKKLRKGDKFSVILLRKILNDEIIHSQLLGVYLCTGGQNFYSFLAKNGKFYNKLAFCLINKIMYFPKLNKFRISSNFNIKRLNPVTGKITPHRGVDFAVPIGTIILSIDDGEVLISKNDIIAGNYISIIHNNKYITRYMHLKKILVKKGQKVKRGEHIAISGNTGRSTGPHLHFEIWINKKAVNPINVKLPCKESIIDNDLNEYIFNIKNINL